MENDYDVDFPGSITSKRHFVDQIDIDITCIMEHRYAFFYWVQWYNHNSIDLVTIDWHIDGGPACEDDLDTLDISNKVAVGYYSWQHLNISNDTQIKSAMYLNVINNVFVLTKSGFCKNPEEYKDKYKNSHFIMYCTSMKEIIDKIKNKQTDSVYLDIDLDYFTNGKGDEHKAVIYPEKLKSILNLEGEFMKTMASKIKGVTIALEPTYCGGIIYSLELLKELEYTLFEGQEALGDWPYN